MSLLKTSNAVVGNDNFGIFENMELKPKQVLFNSETNFTLEANFSLKPKAILWDNPLIPMIFNNMEHVTIDGTNKAYSRNAQGVWPLVGELQDGWNYCEFAASNWANVAAGFGVMGDNSAYLGSYYLKNTVTNGERMALLVKLPEGIMWRGSDAGWLEGDPVEYHNTNGASGAGIQMNVAPYSSITFGRQSGTKSDTTYFYIYDGSPSYQFTLFELLGLSTD